MSRAEELISRMKAVANTTGDALREALQRVKDLAPDISETMDLLTQANRNGLLVEEYLARISDEGLSPVKFDIGWRLLCYWRKHNSSRSDRKLYIDDLGDIYSSTYNYNYYDKHRCAPTFKVVVLDPGCEDKNQRALKDILEFLTEYSAFKERVYQNIEKQILEKEVKS